jgi:RNA 2',3'-cyclic 3'-phosphodiesterase
MGRQKQSAERRDGTLIRTFICVEIPESIRERIGVLQETLRQTDAQVSWTKPSNIHLTLKFLGGVAPTRIERVAKAVERAASGIHHFEIEVSGAGCFPSVRSPRVLWIGLPNPPEELKKLYANIEDELADEGFPRENRKFSPHLTIGRPRNPKNSAGVAESLMAEGFAPERFTATEVIVMRSQLKPTGSIYTPQAMIKMG